MSSYSRAGLILRAIRCVDRYFGTGKKKADQTPQGDRREDSRQQGVRVRSPVSLGRLGAAGGLGGPLLIPRLAVSIHDERPALATSLRSRPVFADCSAVFSPLPPSFPSQCGQTGQPGTVLVQRQASCSGTREA